MVMPLPGLCRVAVAMFDSAKLPAVFDVVYVVSDIVHFIFSHFVMVYLIYEQLFVLAENYNNNTNWKKLFFYYH